eukprot:620448-Pleurochrysis_carterae.AAC.3
MFSADQRIELAIQNPPKTTQNFGSPSCASENKRKITPNKSSSKIGLVLTSFAARRSSGCAADFASAWPAGNNQASSVLVGEKYPSFGDETTIRSKKAKKLWSAEDIQSHSMYISTVITYPDYGVL